MANTMNLAALETARIARGGDASKHVYSVGTSGTSYAGKTGEKLHVLINGPFAAYGACGVRNGARVSMVVGRDTDAVTCSKCQAWLAKMAQFGGAR